jgi:hypothetical protein
MRFSMSWASSWSLPDGRGTAGAADAGGGGRMGRPERVAEPPKRRRRVSMRSFYGSSLTEGERVDLETAAELENLDEEIAVLRVRLKTALKDHPKDYALLVRGIGMLTKAVATQYRLSPRASKDLADRFAAVLNSVGDQLFPEGR